MTARVLWCLGVVVMAAVLRSLPVESQCTAKHCYNDDETDVMKMLLNIQQEIVSLKEDLSLKEECSSEKEEMASMKEEMASMKEEISSLKENLTVCLSNQLPRPSDCADVLRQGHTISGVYTINPRGPMDEMPVYCDMTTNGGGWMVFQRREDGSVDFYRDWVSYKRGFGNPTGEFWLGNDYLHELTSQKLYTLRVDLEDWEQKTAYAEYSTFHIGQESNGYILTVGSFSGTAGDSLHSYHDGQRFSTKDRDNDQHPLTHCSQFYKGAWWYNGCYLSNLNGKYQISHQDSNSDGIQWYTFNSGRYSIKKSEMKIRPTDFPRQ